MYNKLTITITGFVLFYLSADYKASRDVCLVGCYKSTEVILKYICDVGGSPQSK